jgi:hypothetical protein
MSSDRGTGSRRHEADTDPDADPDMVQEKPHQQPDQAEGADEPSETRAT